MFPPVRIARACLASLRERARRVVALAVAFLTLDDPSCSYDDLSSASHGDLSGAPRSLSDDLVTHPHRRPLRAPSRARRPRAGAPRAQRCVSPTAPRAIVPKDRRATLSGGPS
jgi:hypothetical protein